MTSPRIFLSPPHMSGKELSYIGEAFQSNYIAPLGPFVDRFEKMFCAQTNAHSSLALSTGTAAMHLALKVLDIKKDDVVFCSSLTFLGGVSPIIFEGATPYFIDSDYDSWNMSPRLLEKAILKCQSQGLKPKAIVLAHIYGIPAKIDEIKSLADKYQLYLIEDSAEALGATYKGSPLGVSKDFSIFSFNGNKIITTSGGGMLVSNNQGWINKARFYSTQAKENFPYYEHIEIGYNYRMSNILAAIGVAQLEVLTDRVQRKKEIFNLYKKHLSKLDLTFMPEPAYGEGNYWLTCILLKNNPEKLRLKLEEYNIESRPTWKPMHLQPVFSSAPHEVDGTSEDIFKRGLCLPSGTSMTNEQVELVCKIIIENYDA